jgi:GNAT superfamily N-acetyltransferase
VSYAIRRLTVHDLAALQRTHQALLSSLSHPQVLRPDGVEHLERNLSRTGITFGAFHDGELIAYAAIEFGGPSARLIETAFPTASLPAAAALAVHDGSGVLPAHRGRGLQDRLNQLRVKEARAHGFQHIVGTVSTRNPFSLRNHLDRGFVVRGYAEIYDGMPRLLMHAGLASETGFDPHACWTGMRQSIVLPGVATDFDILDRGLVGVSVGATSAGWRLSCLPIRLKNES